MIYIANDVESAGSKLGVHSTLSWGACVIAREELSFNEYFNRRLVFYAELQPDSWLYEMEAMKVACSQLMFKQKVFVSRSFLPHAALANPLDVDSSEFDPTLLLNTMMSYCEHPMVAVNRFNAWMEEVKKEFKDEKVTGVTDTVFFDGGRVDELLSKYSNKPSPYGHSGLDLDSVYRGYAKRADAKLKELGVPDERTKPHRADHDAVYLAQIGRELLFKKMGW